MAEAAKRAEAPRHHDAVAVQRDRVRLSDRQSANGLQHDPQTQRSASAIGRQQPQQQTARSADRAVDSDATATRTMPSRYSWTSGARDVRPLMPMRIFRLREVLMRRESCAHNQSPR